MHHTLSRAHIYTNTHTWWCVWPQSSFISRRLCSWAIIQCHVVFAAGGTERDGAARSRQSAPAEPLDPQQVTRRDAQAADAAGESHAVHRSPIIAHVTRGPYYRSRHTWALPIKASCGTVRGYTRHVIVLSPLAHACPCPAPPGAAVAPPLALPPRRAAPDGSSTNRPRRS